MKLGMKILENILRAKIYTFTLNTIKPVTWFVNYSNAGLIGHERVICCTPGNIGFDLSVL